MRNAECGMKMPDTSSQMPVCKNIAKPIILVCLGK